MSIKLTIDANDWQRQVNQAVKTLERLSFNFENEQRKILEYAAHPMVDAMQAGAPVGTEVHYRYPKSRGGRARRGEGQRIATYYPGNLRKSFRVLDLKRTKDVIVGAKLAKGASARGLFGFAKYDAYYLNFVEYGTRHMAAKPFVRPAIIRASPAVIRRVQLGCDRFAARFAKQNAG